MYLLIVDTTQIQPFVFGTNRLRENIGASHLVASVTGEWSLETVRSIAPQNNTHDARLNKLDESLSIEDGALEAEVIYAGGGNFAVLFRDKDAAEKFERTLSLGVLERAPNLQTVIAKREFDWSAQPPERSLVQTFDEVLKQLQVAKRSSALSAPLLGLSVTVSCHATGLPATEMSPVIGTDDTSSYPASAEALAKIIASENANARLQDMCKEALSDSFDFPFELDKLGRSQGEQSQIAVVHSDGDGMGKRLQKLGEQDEHRLPVNNSYAIPNRKYVKALRGFSNAVDQAGREALRNVVAKLISRIDTRDGVMRHPGDKAGKTIVAPLNLELRGDKYLLPMRPIVFGGDDVTFVCDGRIGLSLAIEYMNQFAAETAKRSNELGGTITSCAGIAIVKAHYPFNRAYMLAEDLAKSAKGYRRRHEPDLPGVACLDWHCAYGGLSGDVAEMRRREYTSQGNDLMVQRPVALKQRAGRVTDAHAWEVVVMALKEFQQDEWSDKRNKVKALRDALREGGDAVERFRKMYRLNELPQLDVANQLKSFREKGWSGNVCGYFDAIELLDLYLPLDEGVTAKGAETDADTIATVK